jgi:NAD(P)-dependent dehydrogenase (short-subunit alcohol dehydrogenase family)
MTRPVAVVTGASSGIGRAFAERLAGAGHEVVAFARPSVHFDEAAHAWAGRLAITAFPGDLSQEGDVERLRDHLAECHGRLDLLINNAGAYFHEDGGLPEMATLQRNLDVNLLGQYRMILACLPFLEQAARPVILNLGSGAGAFSQVKGPGPTGYRVSKAALHMLTRTLAFELKSRNIAVHAADPGYIKTRLNPDGTGTPEQAVEGMWQLVTLHDLNQAGQLWLYGNVAAW